MHDLLVRPPKNMLPDIDPDARYILFAAGLGVPTITGIAGRLSDAGASFELHHFARSSDRALSCAGSKAFASRGRAHNHIGLSVDQMEREIVHALSPTHANTHVYCSGPPRLVDLIHRHARDWVYPRNVHSIHLGERGSGAALPRT
jgi:ferredoxin-NADP reductase